MCIGLIAAALAGIALGAEPATVPATAPAAATATAPATTGIAATAPAPSPREVAEAYLTGVVRGDEKAVYTTLIFTSDDARREGDAVIGEALAQEQLDATVAMAYERPAPGQATFEDRQNGLVEAVRKGLASAEVKESGDTAEVTIPPRPTILLVRQGDVWKIDFDKTQRANQASTDKLQIARAAARAQIYRDVTAKVRAGKYSSAKQANEEVNKRIDDLPPLGATGTIGSP